jgi:HEAT repeat protein
MALGRKTGGRAKGVPNKATADIKALAQVHAEAAITELARLAVAAESEPARVAAIKELLDRGFGKSKQALIGGDEDDNPIKSALTVKFVG